MSNEKDPMSDAFEGAFSNYLDSDLYDQAEETLFSMIRDAYKAGWRAAGGELAEIKVLHPSESRK